MKRNSISSVNLANEEKKGDRNGELIRLNSFSGGSSPVVQRPSSKRSKMVQGKEESREIHG